MTQVESDHKVIAGAVDAERRRIIGLILKAYREAHLAGEMAIADALDKLATLIENS